MVYSKVKGAEMTKAEIRLTHSADRRVSHKQRNIGGHER